VVFDPDYRGKISAKTQHMNVDYSVFEGWKIEGRPSVVTVRGQVAVRDGKFVGKLAAENFCSASRVISNHGWT
jgi:dihydropyrimidinase